MTDIDSLNRVDVTFDDLWRLAKEAGVLRDTGARDVKSLMSLIAGAYRDQPMKGAAVLLRMQALVRLLEEEGATGWTLQELPDGSVPTQERVFEAAALQPLVQEDEHARFEREEFLAKVGELAAGR